MSFTMRIALLFRNGRKFIGIEIQKEYSKIAERRLQEEKDRQRSNSGAS